MEASTRVVTSDDIGKETTNKPVQKFRAGPISATIWANEITTKNGELSSFYTISLDRAYKDKDGDWKHSSSLRLHDLPRAQLVLSKAYEYLALAEVQ